MRIEFKDFGQTGSGAISLADLTVICGPNSSGKTYTSYAVYAVLKHFSSFFDFGIESEVLRKLLDGEPAEINLKKIKDDFANYLADAGVRFASGLDRFFNAPDDFFSGTKFSFKLEGKELRELGDYRVSLPVLKGNRLEGEIDPEAGTMTLAYSHDQRMRIPRQLLSRIVSDVIFDALLEEKIPSPFVVTSERTGVALFYKDLDVNSNAIVSHLRDSEKINPTKIIEAMRSRYAQPIQDNIDTVRDYDNISKRKSFLREAKDEYKYVFDALNDLLGGGAFRSSNGQLVYSPRKKRNQPRIVVPLYIASSSVKSLFLVDMYINHVARKNQILIIDEPELNLHPDNQVKFARLIARLVNVGVKVLLTTHSDYVVREINNLVSLSGVGNDSVELLNRYRLSEQDMLTPDQVRAYCADPSSGFCEMSVSKSGIDTAIFDTIIADENVKAQDIYLSIEE